MKEMKKWYILLWCLSASVCAFADMARQDSTAVTQPDSVVAYHRVQLKTNLAGIATLTPNLSLEVALAPQHSIQLDAAYNPFRMPGGNYHKLHDYALQYRYYFDYVEHGSFIGAHLGAGAYNVSAERVPFAMVDVPGFQNWRWGFYKDSRYQGYQAFVGFHYGYKWRLGDHWRIEALLGIGAAYLDYGEYECAECGTRKATWNDLALGLTRAQLSVGYSFGKARPARGQYLPEAVLPVVHDTVMIAAVPDTVVIAAAPDTVVVRAEADTVVVIRDVDHTRRISRIDGEADIRFVVSRTEIDTTYLGNAEQLASLAELLNRYADDPDVVMMLVTIHGMASPEGPYAKNALLAQGRAQAVVDRLQTEFKLPQQCRLYSTYTAENWEGLKEYVKNDKTLAKDVRAAILRIISRAGNLPDTCEKKLQTQYPDVYKHLLRDCFPYLRKTEYHIEVFYKE